MSWSQRFILTCNISIVITNIFWETVVYGFLFYLLSGQCWVLNRNQSFVFLCKTNDWFLHETQHWCEIGWVFQFPIIHHITTNAPRVFQNETTWNWLFPCRFNMEYTCVCRNTCRLNYVLIYYIFALKRQLPLSSSISQPLYLFHLE